MSRPKRKVGEVGEQALSAAVGDVMARTISLAVRRYDAHVSVDDQLERLDMPRIMVHSAVDAAEGVHIASWWLRRWLWRLRDAALDGDVVLRWMRRRRAALAAEEAAGNRLWNAARRVARSAKTLLLAGGGDDTERLGRTVATLEKACADLGDFVKLLELDIRRSQQPAEVVALQCIRCGATELPPRIIVQPAGSRICRPSGPQNCLPCISDKEYTASRRRTELQIVGRKLRGTIGRLRNPPTTHAPPDFVAPDAERLRTMVAGIHRAVGASDLPEVVAKPWLARWRRGLQAVADRADHVLHAMSTKFGPGEAGGDEAGVTDNEVRTTTQGVETAVANLRAFVTLVRLAICA